MSNAPAAPAASPSKRRKEKAIAEAVAKPMGRPSWYHPSMNEQAYKLALLGFTDEEIANALEIPFGTLERWKAKQRHFREAIARGRAPADAEVAVKLRERALGYSHPAVKIFAPKQEGGEPVKVEYIEHYPPDTAAASLWLRNRQPKLWREKTDIDLKADLTLEHLVLGAIEKRETPDLPPAITDDRRDED